MIGRWPSFKSSESKLVEAVAGKFNPSQKRKLTTKRNDERRRNKRKNNRETHKRKNTNIPRVNGIPDSRLSL